MRPPARLPARPPARSVASPPPHRPAPESDLRRVPQSLRTARCSSRPRTAATPSAASWVEKRAKPAGTRHPGPRRRLGRPEWVGPVTARRAVAGVALRGAHSVRAGPPPWAPPLGLGRRGSRGGCECICMCDRRHTRIWLCSFCSTPPRRWLPSPAHPTPPFRDVRPHGSTPRKSRFALQVDLLLRPGARQQGGHHRPAEPSQQQGGRHRSAD